MSQVHIAMHGVMRKGEQGWEHSLSCTTDRLRMIVERLQYKGYTIVPCAEIDSASGTKVASLSFDDGYLNNWANAYPLLVDMGVPATFFIVTCTLEGKLPPNRILEYAVKNAGIDAVTKTITNVLRGTLYADMLGDTSWNPPGPFLHEKGAMARVKTLFTLLPLDMKADLAARLILRHCPDLNGSQQCEEMLMGARHLEKMRADGMEIGSHSHTHAYLHNRSKGEVVEEIDSSLSILSAVTGPVRSFCTPYGNGQIPPHILAIANTYKMNFFNYQARNVPSTFQVTPNFFERIDHRLFEAWERHEISL